MSDPVKPPTTPPPAPTGAAPEDAGFQALSEALGSSFVIVKIIMGILVVVFLGSGFFTVASQERAIVLRFGKPVGVGEEQLLQPGPHWAFPYPIDEVVRIPFTLFQTAVSSAGWHPPGAEANPSVIPFLNPEADGYTLTKDGNLMHVRATMRYRISDPLQYALNFVNASNVVIHVLDNALFYSSEFFTIDDSRTNNQAIKEMITQRVEALVQAHELGIKVEQVNVEAKPPLSLNASFEAVSKAEQDRGQTNQAMRTYAATVTAKAQGEANAVINAGQTERNRLILETSSELNAFTNQLVYYRANPQFWLNRTRDETAIRVFTNRNLSKKFVPERIDDIRLHLGERPEGPKTYLRNTGQ